MPVEPRLLDAIGKHLSKVAEFDAFKVFEGVSTKAEFLRVLAKDPAFAPFLLDNPKYVKARIGGNLVTSLHRKLGDLYQDAFRILLSETLGIPEGDLKHGVEIEIDGKKQKRSTDGLIRFTIISAKDLRRVKKLAIKKGISGFAFEVRSCYKIGDSKRIQADRDMALSLKDSGFEPVMLIFCSTSLRDPVDRLKDYWSVYEGNDAFGFIERLTRFDLYKFLIQQREYINRFMENIFNKMET